MTSKLGWNTSTPVNQPPNPPPPQHPPHAYTTPTYPPPSNSAPPPSAPYYPPHTQDPPPYRTALSTFYVNDPPYSPSAPSTPHSPPPPYDEFNNNNYPNFAYPSAQPPPPVQTPHQPQYPPIPHHQHNSNGNPPAQPPHSTAQPYDNRGSSVHRSLYGDSRRQIPDENFNHDNQRIYPDISNHRTQSYKSHPHHNETPLPPNSVLLWEGSRPIRIYFVQQEGHVVSPDKDLKFTAYKLPPGNARNASVLVKADNAWRLGLSKERSYIVRGVQGEFAFYDDSTSPARCVVIVFQNQLKKEEKQRLDVLLTGCSQTSNEPSNAVDRFESGFGSAYDSFTDSFDNMIKKQTPGIHKNTNWLRKNTGQAVRFGGSLVSKGIHFVSDSHIDKTKPKEATNRHYEIFNALRFYRIAIEKKQVSRVTSYS